MHGSSSIESVTLILSALFVSDGKTESWESLLTVHVLAPSIIARETIKSMKERNVDDGHIINISA